MSVVPMKMLTVAGPAGAIDDVICTCLINQQFHPVETSAVAGKSMKLTPLAWSNPWQDLLSTAQKLLEEMDIPFTFQDFRQQQLAGDDFPAEGDVGSEGTLADKPNPRKYASCSGSPTVCRTAQQFNGHLPSWLCAFPFWADASGGLRFAEC